MRQRLGGADADGERPVLRGMLAELRGADEIVVQGADGVAVRQVVDGREQSGEMLDPRPGRDAGRAQRRHVRIARRARRRIGGPVGEPGEALARAGDQIRELGWRLAETGRLGELRRSDAGDLGIDRREALPHAQDRRLDILDDARLLARPDRLDDRLQEPNGGLELLEAFALGRRDADGEIAHAVRQLPPQHRQRRLPVRDDQNAAAGRQVVTDDVGDGVRLAGAGWSLDDDPVRLLEPADDLDLLVVVGLWKEEIRRRFGFDNGFGGAVVRLAEAGAERAPRSVGTLLRAHDERLGRTRKIAALGFVGDGGFQLGDVGEQEIVGAAASEQHPPVGDGKPLVGGRNRRRRLEGDLVGQIPAFAVEPRLAGPQGRLEALPHERRDAVVACGGDGSARGVRRQGRPVEAQRLVRAQIRQGGRGARPDPDLAGGLLGDLDLDETLDQRQVDLDPVPVPARETETPDQLEGLIRHEIR